MTLDRTPSLYRVTTGPEAGALVRFHFVNNSGNADCRYAEPFGGVAAGEIVVLRPEDLAAAEEVPDA